MKKNFVFTAIFLSCLAFSVVSVQAAPPSPPPSHHGPSHHVSHYRPPVHHGHFYQPPRGHHYHHVRHSRYIGPCYCPYCYPIGLNSRIYYPLYNRNLGVGFHITL